MSAISSAEPTIIQVDGTDVWTGLVFGAFVLALGLGVLVVIAVMDLRGTSAGDFIGSLVVGGVFIVFTLALGGFALRRSVGHIRSKLPAMRLDADGIECAHGRVSWSNVTSVEETVDGDGGASLRFRLEPGTAWAASEAAYSTYLLNTKNEKGFEMDYWAKPREVREILSRYYSGPISLSSQ